MPLDNNCKAKNLVYQAEVTEQNNGQVSSYVGLCSTDFKTRYGNHKKAFNNEAYLYDSKLSEHIWELKRKNIEYDISWKEIDRGKPFSPHMSICQLCTREKYFILFEPSLATLNSRFEIGSKCKHIDRCLLKEN